MPLSQNPIVEWPTEFHHLLHGLQVEAGPDGMRSGRTDVDVDRDTLFGLNDFEARVRQRRVQLRWAERDDCLVGEMNVLVGLGAAADPSRHIGRIRISFSNLQEDRCIDPVPEM